MVTWDEFVKRFNKLTDYLNDKSGDILMKHERKIIDLNNAQLLEGKNIANKIMQRGYSPGYAKTRRKAGLQTSVVDLKFSGKYQNSRRGVKVKQGMNILSGVDYEKYLRGNFPGHVGLTEKNSDIIKKDLLDDIAKEIKKFLVS